MPDIESDFSAELAQIQAESICWIPLEEGVYLYIGDENAKGAGGGLASGGSGGVAGGVMSTSFS